MASKIRSVTWVDEDGAQLWVQTGWSGGRVILDTDPDGPGVDTMINLNPHQVQELIRVLGGTPRE